MAAQIELPGVAAQLPVKQDSFMQLIDRAVNGGADADVVGKMLDHWERFQKMQAKQAFDEAMQNFKQSVPAVVKNRIADMGKFKIPYADIEGVCDTIEPSLMANGLDKRWTTELHDKGIVMVCIIKHVAGHSETTVLPPAPPEDSGTKNDVQAIGSSLSYLQRYSLLMALGIAPRNADKDGNKHGISPQDADKLQEWLDSIESSASLEELESNFREAYKANPNQTARDAIVSAKNRRKGDLRGQR